MIISTFSQQVFLAVHDATGVGRAVKRVRRVEHAADEALQKEVKVMQILLGCPHVVNVLDAFIDDEYRYMVTSRSPTLNYHPYMY